MGVSSRPIAVPSSLPWIFVSRDSIGKEERRGTVVIEICDREFDGKRIKISILKEFRNYLRNYQVISNHSLQVQN